MTVNEIEYFAKLLERAVEALEKLALLKEKELARG